MRKIQPNNGTEAEIEQTLAAVSVIRLHEDFVVAGDVHIRAFYAGHVLGAVSFHVRVGNDSVFYSGDFNTTPDRHLGPAEIPCVHCDVLITESTYATSVRDSRRVREHEFIQLVDKTVMNGGKVLVPVFALGRAQELCLLLDNYWRRAKYDIPILFSSPMTQQANAYYSMYLDWTSSFLQQQTREKGMPPFVEFSKVKQLTAADEPMLAADGPLVLFSTPGMLHAGHSLKMFLQWCSDPRNTVIMPGYCVEGTVGYSVLHCTSGKIRVGETEYDVKCNVRALSFSAHADYRGIVSLMKNTTPQQVVLVHGECAKMRALRRKVEREAGLAVSIPANACPIRVACGKVEALQVPVAMLARDGTVSRVQVDETSRKLGFFAASIERSGSCWCNDESWEELHYQLHVLLPWLKWVLVKTPVAQIEGVGSSVVLQRVTDGEHTKLVTSWCTADDLVANRVASLVDSLVREWSSGGCSDHNVAVTNHDEMCDCF